MKTSEFPYFSCDFYEFNAAQSQVIPFLNQDVNVVVAFPTSTGKTAIAECAFGFHLSEETNSKVVYISPFKGITSERLRDWADNYQFSRHGILVCTGDTHPTDEEYQQSRIILMTSEAFDNKTRTAGKLSWLKKVSCLVLDEAHLIGKDNRGAAVEMSLLRFSRINPSARMILLSATMSNSLEVARWVKSLNGKPTKNIRSTWRPVKLIHRIHSYKDNCGWTMREQNKIKAIVEQLEGNNLGEKILVFVQSKKFGKELLKALKKKHIRSGFHHAAVSAENRQKLEQIFDDPYSGVDVLIATSTLAAGVNLG